jgi:hypothetical protein
MSDDSPRATLGDLLDALQGFLTHHLPSDWWEEQRLQQPRGHAGSLESLGYTLLGLLRDLLAAVHPDLPLRQVLADAMKALAADRSRAELRRWRKPVLEWPCGAIVKGIPEALAGLRKEERARAHKLGEEHRKRLELEQELREREQQQRQEERTADFSARPFYWKRRPHLFPPHQARLLHCLNEEEGKLVHEETVADDVWGGHPPRNWKTNLRKLQYDTNLALSLRKIPLEIRRPRRRASFLRLQPV